MCRSLRNLLIILACAAVCTLFVLLPTSSGNLSKVPAETVKDADPRPSINREPIDMAKYQQQLKQVMGRMDENFKKSDQLNTPEVREMVSRATRNQLPKKYGPLFAKWNLSQEVSEQVLHMIFERDERIRNASYKRDKEGRSGIPEYRWTEATERQNTRLQLELILGKDRSDELAWTEVEQQYEALAKITGKSVSELKEERRNGQVVKPRPSTPLPVFKRE